ncbi:hypothetical protein ABI_24890 [Asticcacaulis biprosthecium C19]|uniref:Uncharacterized protein n=1 Tax=Asticcacaulis biprosthecium C19 TaxID=715226 RepID=F4QP18_9CAUL|nr:hypothetical protein ABI_24890 [Asticcacaulis biprosthecium C19]
MLVVGPVENDRQDLNLADFVRSFSRIDVRLHLFRPMAIESVNAADLLFDYAKAPFWVI